VNCLYQMNLGNASGGVEKVERGAVVALLLRSRRTEPRALVAVVPHSHEPDR
jgi:hypothetical protein